MLGFDWFGYRVLLGFYWIEVGFYWDVPGRRGDENTKTPHTHTHPKILSEDTLERYSRKILSKDTLGAAFNGFHRSAVSASVSVGRPPRRR